MASDTVVHDRSNKARFEIHSYTPTHTHTSAHTDTPTHTHKGCTGKSASVCTYILHVLGLMPSSLLPSHRPFSELAVSLSMGTVYRGLT